MIFQCEQLAYVPSFDQHIAKWAHLALYNFNWSETSLVKTLAHKGYAYKI